MLHTCLKILRLFREWLSLLAIPLILVKPRLTSQALAIERPSGHSFNLFYMSPILIYPSPKLMDLLKFLIVVLDEPFLAQINLSYHITVVKMIVSAISFPF